MTTTLELLRQQHREALARLRDVEASGTPSALAGLLEFLQRDLAEHRQVEEDALFPILARRSQLNAGPLRVMNAEHRELRALTADLAAALRGTLTTPPAAVATALMALLRAHIAKEDDVLFPVAESLLNAAERDEIEVRAAASIEAHR